MEIDIKKLNDLFQNRYEATIQMVEKFYELKEANQLEQYNLENKNVVIDLINHFTNSK